MIEEKQKAECVAAEQRARVCDEEVAKMKMKVIKEFKPVGVEQKVHDEETAKIIKELQEVDCCMTAL